MNFASMPSAGNMQLNMDIFRDLMSSGPMDSSLQQQQQQPQTIPAAPQALLEQQMRLAQLQQLQQLQNQIFQQQLELLSSQNSFATLLADRQRDQQQQQQYGLPTPSPSTTHPSPDFVSPMLIQTSGGTLSSVPQSQQLPPGQVLSDYIPSHMIPPTPHSAPAHIAFQASPPLSLPSSAELDFSDISPLTSPWLGAYTHPASQAVPSRPSSSNTGTGSKRRNASSSGDESALSKPSRKRQSSVRISPRANSGAGCSTNASQKKAALRGTRSANSTPLFPALARPIAPGVNMGDIPGDSPSPIELPPMPPPAQLPPSVSAQANAPPSVSIMPVTPASIMNLGRLSVSSGLVPPQGAQDSTGSKKKEGSSRGKSGAAGEPHKATKAGEKPGSVPLVSPVLKPILPAGNAPVTAGNTSPCSVAEPFRKTSHKAAEQKRRDSLKTSFDDLRLLLPPIPLPSEEGFPDEPLLPGAMPPRGPPKGNVEGPNRGVSKLQLLRCGNDYIRVLKGRVERRDEEIERLRIEMARLRVLAGPEEAGEVDLEKDLDAVEATMGGLFGKGQMGYSMNASAAEGEDREGAEGEGEEP
ncbi:uncharacterized protein LAESUDRAFT_744299 [Laetiporus sulphureus 93-53]|uniref:BHLH domain-containing protein n=1 Tax=Laetiporus sulphureus 93-53 TaxID=1314785 RepID=A0A165DBQ4_9APHY|nr:uncharacterized protein LAESUDRAFT_744299 [Laetiporus sulphureus 93-53]KZT04499.1 hypothetical protein LAESUDRAFT_744299 [Laetiporus sulphureus 93-53]